MIIISFRGTVNLINDLEDINFVKKDYPYCNGCEVHTGFLEAWESLENSTMSYLSSLVKSHSDADILITGHSLGGAIAEFAALELI